MNEITFILQHTTPGIVCTVHIRLRAHKPFYTLTLTITIWSLQNILYPDPNHNNNHIKGTKIVDQNFNPNLRAKRAVTLGVTSAS